MVLRRMLNQSVCTFLSAVRADRQGKAKKKKNDRRELRPRAPPRRRGKGTPRRGAARRAVRGARAGVNSKAAFMVLQRMLHQSVCTFLSAVCADGGKIDAARPYGPGFDPY